MSLHFHLVCTNQVEQPGCLGSWLQVIEDLDCSMYSAPTLSQIEVFERCCMAWLYLTILPLIVVC